MLGTLQFLEEEIIKETSRGTITIDLSDASFRMSHDFFSVLRKRHGKEHIICILPSGTETSPFEWYGMEIITEWTRSEFEKEFSKKHILRHNFTALEYIKYEMKRVWQFLIFYVERHRKWRKYIKISGQRGSFFLIIFGLIMSVSLLLFIFYFAISKTLVYIEPQMSIRPVSSNIIFSASTGASILTPKNKIDTRRESISFEHSMKFNVTAIDPNSISNAKGIIVIYNELTQDQDLKPNTRFTTDDGLVFRSEGWIKVPKSKTINGVTEIGSIEVSVVADTVDIFGVSIWDRGNIPDGVTMTIPGLKFNRDRVYARSKGSFSGWQNPLIHVLIDEELARFKNLIREQTKKLATEALVKYISDQNKSKNEDYELLMGDSVSFQEGDVELLGGLKTGVFADEVELRMTVSTSALFYDKKSTVAYLKQLFHEWLLSGTDKEVAVHENSLRISNIISRSEGDLSIKATMEMDATITYDFENPANELTRQMKVLIAGLDRDTAKARIMNTGYVRDVTIKFSPFWMRRVSNNLDNIEFVIQK